MTTITPLDSDQISIIQVQSPPVVAIAQIQAGLPGPAGASSVDKFYTFNQEVASATWIINHFLKKFPSVTVVDSAGDTILIGPRYIDKDRLQLIFNSPFAGIAYLN
jgi:hypothetical protein